MLQYFYIVPIRFDVIISPSSGSWHQRFFKTYSNKIGHNKHAVSTVQNVTGLGQECVSKYKYEDRKSVHHLTIQIIQPTRCNSFTSSLLDVYVWLNMFRESPRPSSGAYNCTSSLWFYRWREGAGALWYFLMKFLPITNIRFFWFK